MENLKNSKLSNLKFKGKWRSYQQRVLDELKLHLNDKKLNIVAAPGAGKTTLGIEVISLLCKPALILTPTITIKNQWKKRIIDGFLVDIKDVSISDNLKEISTITISTYQAIHSLMKEKQLSKKFIEDLKRNNIQTVVLDEAHHLRTEWYNTLEILCKKLKSPDFTVVSLTGTPPYDVSASEWNNYHSLCGPVDAEISVPELVKNGDLCPHQDLIYFSNITDDEKKIVLNFEKNREEFYRYIIEKPEFLYSIQTSDFIANYEQNLDLLYKNSEFTVSIISYLLDRDSLNMQAHIITEFLGLSVDKIPNFTYEIAQILVNGMLGKYSENFKNTLAIKNKLKELKLIKARTVDLVGEVNLKKLCARSINKLNAIEEITKFEYKSLSNNLREVVLLDYIGRGDSVGLNIYSVFDKLYSTNIRLCILTGTVIVIPVIAKEKLYELLSEKEISKDKVLTTEFKQNYIRLETYGDVEIVSIVTELFKLGYINVLIGTAALLGEGWDSPCVNTLVIASVVSSFMLSNQMRGRALRIDKDNPDKTANIWHLVSLSSDYETSYDFLSIKKRFNTFDGISYYDEKITNGIERLNLDEELLKENNCVELNKQLLVYAQSRNTLREKWKQVFKESKITEANLAWQLSKLKVNNNFSAEQIIEVLECNKTKTSYIDKQIPKYSLFLFGALEKHIVKNQNKKKNFVVEKICSKLVEKKVIRNDYENVILNNYSIYREQKEQSKIANCLVKTLCSLNIFKSDYQNIKIKFFTDNSKHYYLTILGCTNYERNLFVKLIKEIFSPADNQRYLLKKDEKYLIVPDVIGSKKENVLLYVKYLETEFGYFDIIFTRNPEGYKELLKAKYNPYRRLDFKNSRIWM